MYLEKLETERQDPKPQEKEPIQWVEHWELVTPKVLEALEALEVPKELEVPKAPKAPTAVCKHQHKMSGAELLLREKLDWVEWVGQFDLAYLLS
jgi:hypothetical protein